MRPLGHASARSGAVVGQSRPAYPVKIARRAALANAEIQRETVDNVQ